jgi:UDP-N-acetylmuramoylalanine--D-glutamate ligase
MIRDKWQDHNVVVVGAARQGLALARYLANHGAVVTINDRRSPDELQAARESLADLDEQVRWALEGHPLGLLEGCDLLCLSGGVPLDLELVQAALDADIPLSNDSQIFLEAVPCPVIGITGSAGKTTTTSLVGEIAHQAQLPGSVWVGGNIGLPLIGQVDEMQPQDLAVMELSSFQLEIMTRAPQVAAILNITPNHLDRHKTMEAYTAAKARILTYQGPDDQAVLNRDDPGAWGLKDLVQGQLFSFGKQALKPARIELGGAYLQDGMIMLRPEPSAEAQPILPSSEIKLRGEHNLLNVLAACAIAGAAGLPVVAMQAGIQGFRGVAHRLEWIRRWGGADWYNDSIATAPERVIAAIRSFDEPLVLLAGGRDKDLPWGDFARLVCERVDHLIAFGEAAHLIAEAVESARRQPGKPSLTRCSGLKEAVWAAANLVEPGDVVLLSPGGTSFDEFIDFEERGTCFAHWVKQLV